MPWRCVGLNIPHPRVSTGHEFQPGWGEQWGVPLLCWCYKLKMPMKTQTAEPRKFLPANATTGKTQQHQRRAIGQACEQEYHQCLAWLIAGSGSAIPITCALWQDGHNPSRKRSLKINLLVLLLLLLLSLRSQIRTQRNGLSPPDSHPLKTGLFCWR